MTPLVVFSAVVVDINDDPNGGINSDVYFGGYLVLVLESYSTFSYLSLATLKRGKSRLPKKNRALRVGLWGAGAQEGAVINLNFSEGTKRVSEANDKYDVTNLVSEEFPDGTHNINIQIDPSLKAYMRVPDKNTILVNPNWLKKVNLKRIGSSLGHELIHVNDYIRGNINRHDTESVRASEHKAYRWQFDTRDQFKFDQEYSIFLRKRIQMYRK